MIKFLDSRLAGLAAWFARRTNFLTHPQAGRWSMLVIPLLLGLLSLASGQDDGWDMRNYHLYNAHALLNGRIGFDFSPAGFQSYFNPTLELPYYYLNQWLPPRAVGFVMGLLHGLAFVLLAGIARQLLGAAAPRRTVLLLAMAGLFAPGFLSELGNTMGDNLSALPALLSLYLVLRCWDALPQWCASVAWTVLAAGAAMGVSAGLKLTNATYAVALCAALLTVPLAWWQRLRLAFVYGVGVLAGVAAAAGWWFLKMWQTFGNPLFPQFNNLFHSPLAQEGGVIDVFFRPQGWVENLFWPFIFAFNTRRVSEIPLKLAVWPVLYLVLAASLAVWLWRRRSAAAAPLPAPRIVFLLAFVAIAYLVWMRMFSIYRYLVPLELLAPLAIWLAWQYIAPQAQRVAGVVLALLALAVFPIANWGHAEWAEQAFSAEVPAIAQPADSIVFFAQPDPPSGWMATFLPPATRVIALGTGLPESPAWRARQLAAIAERPGPHYLLLSAARNDRDGTRLRKLAFAQSLGWTDDAAGCNKLASLMQHVRLQVELRRLPSGGCTFDLLPQHRIDLAAQDRTTIAQAADRLQQYGLQLDAASCVTQPAAIGAEPRPFLWCRVGLRDRTAAR
ncbi:hypothetical protein GTP46_00185 [Duganella sp. FT135W]|uniref:DUF2029 domain-containing protein n=1 Tax=Duganella flavida TaxID=2692175 RepID=A0A6L8K3E0_9BURK|nr:hypothetical protein [Duganella flavida]MYM21067.1 hypothetical protein [Duganella flavida]